MSFQTLARKTVNAVNTNKMKLTMVDPVMQGGTDFPGKTNWIPIKPTSDGAFVLGIMHWIFEEGKFNAAFLECSNDTAAKAIGFNSFTNATNLVIVDDKHPNNRKFLRATDIGLAGDSFIVMDKATGKPMPAEESKAGQLFVEGEIDTPNGSVKVASSLYLLRRGVYLHSLEDYAKYSNTSKEQIIKVATDFTSHGHKVAVDTLGGTTSVNGLAFTTALWMLPALVGAYNMKGGMGVNGPSYKAIADGPRYDLSNFEGKVSPSGVKISREQFAYEKTTEYKNKVAAGLNPYPSKLPWHNVGMSLDGQAMFSALNKYPYQCKVLINCFANPVYATPGFYRDIILKELEKTSNIPLIISIDVVMGETTAYADYIVPDVSVYEQWAMVPVRANINTKMTAVRWPVIEAMTPKAGNHKQPMSMETYLIDVAKKLNMPGFGDNVIKDNDGKLWPLNTAEDFFLKAVANIAYDEEPVKPITATETKITGLEQVPTHWTNAIRAEEMPLVKNVLAKGGRFEPDNNYHNGEFMRYGSASRICFYSEKLATSKNSFTGKPYEGTPVWMPELLADGTTVDDTYSEQDYPFKATSSKAKLRGVTMLSNSPTLQTLSNTNYIEINIDDAEAYGLKDGQQVTLKTPTNQANGILKARKGVARGTLGISFGYGKWEYGSKDVIIDGKLIAGDKNRSTGIALNPLALDDPSVGNIYSLSEVSSGTHNRNGVRVKIIPLT
jgi:tetrathionate reductase subunit A